MRLIQRVRYLCSVLKHLLQRQRPLLQTLRQRLSLDAFHHQIIDPILRTNIVKSTDVRVIQTGDRLRFALKALFASGILRKLRGQNFDGDAAFETRIPSALHLSHAASTKRCRDFIMAQVSAWSKGHRWRDYRPRIVL